MFRRNFLKGFSLAGIGSMLSAPGVAGYVDESAEGDRDYWVKMLQRIVLPPLEALASNKLVERMPVETAAGMIEGRKKVTYLEMLGRSLTGIAPWLELGEDSTPEGQVRKKIIGLSVASIRNAVTPSSPGYMNFTEGGQPLVDAAFLAHALLRAPRQLWGNLDAATQQHLVRALQATRAIKPHYSNWLLFTGRNSNTRSLASQAATAKRS